MKGRIVVKRQMKKLVKKQPFSVGGIEDYLNDAEAVSLGWDRLVDEGEKLFSAKTLSMLKTTELLEIKERLSEYGLFCDVEDSVVREILERVHSSAGFQFRRRGAA